MPERRIPRKRLCSNRLRIANKINGSRGRFAIGGRRSPVEAAVVGRIIRNRRRDALSTVAFASGIIPLGASSGYHILAVLSGVSSIRIA